MSLKTNSQVLGLELLILGLNLQDFDHMSPGFQHECDINAQSASFCSLVAAVFCLFYSGYFASTANAEKFHAQCSAVQHSKYC